MAKDKWVERNAGRAKGFSEGDLDRPIAETRARRRRHGRWRFL
jgi:hypothetical protein